MLSTTNVCLPLKYIRINTFEEIRNYVTPSDISAHFSGQYVQAFRTHPHEPLYSICIGLTFIHMASQKYVLKRHALIVQVINLDFSLRDCIFLKNE